MMRAAALALTVAGVLWARRLAGETSEPSAGTALVLGFTLIGAWLTGQVLKRLRIPQLSGYLLFGVLVGPYLGNVLTLSLIHISEPTRPY